MHSKLRVCNALRNCKKKRNKQTNKTRATSQFLHASQKKKRYGLLERSNLGGGELDGYLPGMLSSLVVFLWPQKCAWNHFFYLYCILARSFSHVGLVWLATFSLWNQHFLLRTGSPLPFPPGRWLTPGGEVAAASGSPQTSVACQSVWDLNAAPLQSDRARSSSEYLQPREEDASHQPTYAAKAGEPIHLITEALLACMPRSNRSGLKQTLCQVYRLLPPFPRSPPDYYEKIRQVIYSKPRFLLLLFSDAPTADHLCQNVQASNYLRILPSNCAPPFITLKCKMFPRSPLTRFRPAGCREASRR